MIVVHENDYVELRRVNPPTSSPPHNIDLHAANGALGGGALSNALPGQEIPLRFNAVKPGVFVCHCAPGGSIATPGFLCQFSLTSILRTVGMKPAVGSIGRIFLRCTRFHKSSEEDYSYGYYHQH